MLNRLSVIVYSRERNGFMYESNIRIKKSSGAFMAKGIFYLIMLLASLYCALFSKLQYISSDYLPFVLGAGITGCLYFSFLFVHTVAKSFFPSDALVITNNGIYDFITYPSKGLFVDWDNISSIRVFGSKKSQLLGIELFDTEIFLTSVKKTVGDEIRANIEAGLPAVVIKQSDLTESLSVLVPELNEYITKTRPVSLIKNTNHKEAPAQQNRENQDTGSYERNADLLLEDEDTDSVQQTEDEIEIPLFSQEMRFSDEDESETVKSIKSARKDMEEIFMLPVDDLIGTEKKLFDLADKKRNTETIMQKTVSVDKNMGTQIFETVKDNIQKNEKSVSAENKLKSRDNKSKQEEEIKSLESLLSMFSIPVTEPVKDDKNENSVKSE